jgi:hypothetical protein
MITSSRERYSLFWSAATCGEPVELPVAAFQSGLVRFGPSTSLRTDKLTTGRRTPKGSHAQPFLRISAIYFLYVRLGSGYYRRCL